MAVLRALEGRTSTRREVLVCTDRTRLPVLASAGPIRSGDGTLLGAVVAYEDLTPIVALERMRKEWTSLVAHDLRLLVTAIISLAGALARHTESPALKRRSEGLGLGLSISR